MYTAASDETSGFKQFKRSAEVNGLRPKVLGLGRKWRGLTEKAILLKQELEKYKDDYNKIVLFTDAYDVLYNAGPREILERFKQFNSRVLFSAEKNCWPDVSLVPRSEECDMFQWNN